MLCGMEGVTDSVRVSIFDESIENHFNVMERIAKLCGDEVELPLNDQMEIDRISSNFKFFREWRQFHYQPRHVKFSCDTDAYRLNSEVVLPQFSSAAVPHVGYGETSVSSSMSDFVFYVGGSVWALDWCPKAYHESTYALKCEFVAVAAHPPESYYHKIGVPLHGCGMVQIWCVVNNCQNDGNILSNEVKAPRKKHRKKLEETSDIGVVKRPRGRPRKTRGDDDSSQSDKIPSKTEPALKDSKNSIEVARASKRPRGRPRKNSIVPAIDTATINILHSNDSNVITEINKPLVQEFIPGDGDCCLSSSLPPPDQRLLSNTNEEKRRYSYANTAQAGNKHLSSYSEVQIYTEQNNGRTLEMENNRHKCNEHDHIFTEGIQDGNEWGYCDASSLPNDIALPRVAICLAHEGKVVWDLKWKNRNICDPVNPYQLGYLAVLLGNGALEVWDIPSPATIRKMYYSSREEGTDPRFVKPFPVFRCSILKKGEAQSLPLAVEWSNPDYILVGCHDGTVALWKFSPSTNCGDTQPFLCFSADTVPIRAVAWNPVERDHENANVIITAGHMGLKFWDIRDPFRPLLDLHPAPRFIYDLDWLFDPKCIILAFDDGTMRLLSLVKCANDAPVHGRSTVPPKQHGLHVFNCSSSAIWSVHASRTTGMVAYCGADGTVSHFELTSKAVEKEPSRNRTPHHACSVLTDDHPFLTVHTPPFRAEKPVPQAPKSTEGRETPPPKMVAMQRVRWNMNKGCDRLLCSGGAAGVVRCQRI